MSHRRRSPRGGFTLVEMLVSVALVVLMMLMFAEIYQIAGEAMSRARGLAENDQRVRTLTTLLTGDVRSRTFKAVIPFAPNEQAGTATEAWPFPDRQGYFYISENDPENVLDDVIQFTIQTTVGTEYPFFGRATQIGATSELNQPLADDGQIDGAGNAMADETGASRYAEVVYFLRGGNLYRRQLLIRDPYIGSNTQPDGFSGDWPPAGGTNSFWNDFDYSARYFAGGTSGVQFIGPDALRPDPAGQFSLANPSDRFGFDVGTGNPREFADLSNDTAFFGRFTHEETSNSGFHYPGRNPDSDSDGSPDDNPHHPGYSLTLSDGVIQEFAGGERVGEDLLMTNVAAFDIKVWDEALSRFVDVGNSITGSDFNQSNNNHRNASPAIEYGPRADVQPAKNRVFDTWKPSLDFNGGGDDPAPFRPMSDNGTAGDTSDDFPKRLKAIQLTIIFFDVPSSQPRQLTLQLDLVR